MQCNVLCSLLYNQMNNSYLSKPPISLYLSSQTSCLVLDKLHCTWFRSMITMYLATRPKLAIIGQTVRIEEKCRLWKIPMEDHVSGPPHPIPGITAASEAPKYGRIKCAINTFVHHRWTMNETECCCPLPPRFVLLLEGGQPALGWEKTVGGVAVSSSL